MYLVLHLQKITIQCHPFEKDLQKLHEQLVAEKVLQISDGRSHRGFNKHVQLMASIDWEKTKDWAKKQVLAYNIY